MKFIKDNYIIIGEESLIRLSEKVNTHIKQGYIPVGSIFIEKTSYNTTIYRQSLILKFILYNKYV